MSLIFETQIAYLPREVHYTLVVVLDIKNIDYGPVALLKCIDICR